MQRRHTGICLAGLSVYLLVICAPVRSEAQLVLSPTEQSIEMTKERVLIVFDPLAERQTTQIQYNFQGAHTPFLVVIPVPKGTEVALGHRRAFGSIFRLVHPISDAGRSISVEFKSWLVNCFAPLAGDLITLQDESSVVPATVVENHALDSPSATRKWFVEKAVSIAPAHVEWMRRYRQEDWSFVALTITPPKDLATEQSIASPVITLTHDATHISHSVYRPAPALTGDSGEATPPAEIAILTEWPVGIEGDADLALNMSESVSAAQLRRLEKKSNGVPWGFRRDGHLTVYQLEDRSISPILRFWKDESIPRKKAVPTKQEKPVIFEIPVEVILLAVLFALRARRGRGKWRFKRQRDQRLR